MTAMTAARATRGCSTARLGLRKERVATDPVEPPRARTAVSQRTYDYSISRDQQTRWGVHSPFVRPIDTHTVVSSQTRSANHCRAVTPPDPLGPRVEAASASLARGLPVLTAKPPAVRMTNEMATHSPLTNPTDYERQLAAACWPIPMTYFRALKSVFYSSVALAGMWIVLQSGVGQTTSIGVFTAFVMFLIFYATETRELELASSMASLTVTFFSPPETDDPDQTDETDD